MTIRLGVGRATIFAALVVFLLKYQFVFAVWQCLYGFAVQVG
jgi:hypothetical protein